VSGELPRPKRQESQKKKKKEEEKKKRAFHKGQTAKDPRADFSRVGSSLTVPPGGRGQQVRMRIRHCGRLIGQYRKLK